MADAPGSERPVPADGGRARLGASGGRRLAVRAEVGRLSRRARERRRRARALVAQRPAAAPLLPRAAAARRVDAAALGARRRDRDRARRRTRLRRDADAPPSGGEPRPQARRRDPGHLRRLRPPALEGEARARAPDREAARRAREGRRGLRAVAGLRRRRAGTEWLQTLQAAGFDGVVAKRLGLPYLPGSRDGVVKVKPHKTADCVVAGIRWKKGGRETIATLLLGLYDDDGASRLRRLGRGRREEPGGDRRQGPAARRQEERPPLQRAEPLGHRRARGDAAQAEARRRGALRQAREAPLPPRHAAAPLPAATRTRRTARGARCARRAADDLAVEDLLR